MHVSRSVSPSATSNRSSTGATRTSEMKRSRAWRPLLRGTLAARARAIALAVGDELKEIELAEWTPGLYLGHGGLVVLYDYLHRIDRRRGWQRVRDHHLAPAMDPV